MPPAPAGRRRWFLAGIAAAGLAAIWLLGIRPHQLLLEPGRQSVFADFLQTALHPASTYEAASVPPGTPPFLRKVALALLTTIQYAGASVGLALVAGALLGFLGSRSWWRTDPASESRRAPAHPARVLVRGISLLLRSVHELIWAILLFAALGSSPLVAVLAIALPYSGTFGKVFAELLEEAPNRAAEYLSGTGASPVAAFFIGILPRALPDLLAYTLYRFECGIRSATVLGFAGIPTVGYYLKLSFDSLHYREVWAYLYALLLLVLLFDRWSAAIRKHLRVRSVL
ncbi:MAG TPA: ABC transporter permease subunit [Verrucomicrobiales bacterium]|nr:ABC transporter permease subunit [Verrucomicrobiales bacterium]